MIITTLAAFPSPGQGVWHLGPIPIRAYAVFIIVGIIAALLIGDRRWVARGGERGVIYDIALPAVFFGLIGGRLYHVLTDWQKYFGPQGTGLSGALRIWEGGLGIWGAVALGGVGAWIACRARGIPLPAFGDAVAPGIVLAQAIGRLGNYFNQELYGRETTVPWGMEIFYRRDPSGIVDPHAVNGVSTGEVFAVVHPTFLYELLWNLIVFALLILIDRRWKIGHGRLFATYVALYCVGRFCVELLRDDAATHLAGIRINSYTSVLVFLGAVVYIVLAKKGREDPALLRGRGDHADTPDLADELVTVAGTSGVVAAAKVAGDEDSAYDSDVDPATTELIEAIDVEPWDTETGESVEPDDVWGDVDVSESDEGVAADEVAAEDAALDVAAVEESGADETDTADIEGDADEVTAEAPTEDASDTAGGDEPELIAAELTEAETSDDADETDEDSAEEPAETETADAEDEPEDEALVEAEAAGSGVEVESSADVEELIDDEHDPVDDPEFEEFLGDDDAAEVEDAPLAETEESGDATGDTDGDAIDAAIDEAVAIEQVTDSADEAVADDSAPAESDTAEAEDDVAAPESENTEETEDTSAEPAPQTPPSVHPAAGQSARRSVLGRLLRRSR